MTSPPASNHEPKRKRGRDRVAAILEAGAATFREKGYDGATMTEIATRSGTAFGSLYRFFPSKEALADALLVQHTRIELEALAAIGDRAAGLTPEGLADEFVDFMLAVRSTRSFAITVIEARGGREDARAEYREKVRSEIAAILRKVFPLMTAAKSEVKAIALLHVLKGIAGTAGEKPSVRDVLVSEYRQIARSFIVSLSP